MRGAITPFSNVTSWRGAQLEHKDNFTFTINLINIKGHFSLGPNWTSYIFQSPDRTWWNFELALLLYENYQV
jgi:hypothetical protein